MPQKHASQFAVVSAILVLLVGLLAFPQAGLAEGGSAPTVQPKVSGSSAPLTTQSATPTKTPVPPTAAATKTPVVLSPSTVIASATPVPGCGDRNLCGLVLSPGFWKNYDKHMSGSQFLALLQATQDYGGLTVSQAVSILDNTGDQYHRFLLSAEINAVWNGDQSNPLVTGLLGGGIYYNPAFPGSPLNGMTVNQINHLAFTSDPGSAGADLNAYLSYTGSTGEFSSTGDCLVHSPECLVPTPTATNTAVPPTATPTATNTPVPPTATPTATNTPEPPTATPTATNTPEPPTATPTATNTPVPPTATPTATNTPEPPTATPTATATATPTTPPGCSTQNLCGLVLSPGFWVNYDKHMSDSQFLALIHATQDYSGLTVAQAVSILGNTGDQYHRFLLSAEINAVWNGDQSNPLVTGLLGGGIYYNPAFPGSPLNGMTVNQINHLAFTSDPASAGADLMAYLTYAGSTAEFSSSGECLVHSRECLTPTPTATPTATATATNTPTATPTQCVAGSLQGTVLDGVHNDAPIAGASVAILGPNGAHWNLFTNANGHFSLSPAPNGAYLIMASAIGYQATAQANAEVNCNNPSVVLRLTPNNEEQPTPTPTATSTQVPPTATPTATSTQVPPTPTSTPTIPVIPPPPSATPTATATRCTIGAIQGSVVDGGHSDAPIANASVVIIGGAGTYTATTNSLGLFSHMGLPNGVYTVMASAAGYQGVAQATAEIQCNAVTLRLRLTSNEEEQPTPTPTVRPTEPPNTDPTPTPLPPAPTPTPPLPPTLPKTGDGPLSNPATFEWLALALVALICGVAGWRGGGIKNDLP